jgi:hypothetical protein
VGFQEFGEIAVGGAELLRHVAAPLS